MTENDVAIRPPTETDVDAICAMIEQIETYYGTANIDPLELRREQTRRALFGDTRFAWSLLCVDRESDALIGFAAWSYIWPAASATHTMFVKELFVSQAHRGKGLGRRLFQELQNIAAARPDCGRIEWTADRGNPAAINFYAKYGFSPHPDKIYYRWSEFEQ